FLLFAAMVQGANRYAIASGDWDDAIWAATAGGSAGSAAVPGSSDDVTIPAGITVNINANAENASSLTLNGTLQYLTNRNLVITNSGFVEVNTGATIIFSKSGQLRGGGNNARGILVTIHAGVTIYTANAMGLNTGTGNTALTGSIGVKPGNVGAPYYDPDITYIYNGNVSQVIGNAVTNARSLTISNSNGVTASGDLTVDTLHTDAGSILDMVTYQLNLSSADNNGTLYTQNVSATPITPGLSWGGIVAYNSSSSQTIVAGDYYDLDGTGGDRIMSPTDTIGIADVFTVGAGIYTVTNSTVDFNGSSDQTIPAFTFDHLIVSNNGTKHIPAATTVQCQAVDVNDAAGIEIDADGGGQLQVL
ncbi:MAG TPA: hypothetical protein VG842_08910, partial [Sediminibacterium sp.]|nr:hypothetical protein [Sediminibacterium sp.]